MSNDSATLLKTSRFNVVRVSRTTVDGRPLSREIIRHPGAVTILPILDQGRVCLIRNHRLSVDQTLIELPAGTLDPGEAPQETARRELLEETGYDAEQLQLLHSFYLSPGILDERMHLFLATGLTLRQAERQPDEQIENLIVSWEQALGLIRAGEIQDAKTIAGLLYFDKFGGSESSIRQGVPANP